MKSKKEMKSISSEDFTAAIVKEKKNITDILGDFVRLREKLYAMFEGKLLTEMNDELDTLMWDVRAEMEEFYPSLLGIYGELVEMAVLFDIDPEAMEYLASDVPGLLYGK